MHGIPPSQDAADVVYAPDQSTEQTATSSTLQSTSASQEAPPLLITAPNPECAECYVEAATSSGTLETAAAIIISAYSITSAYLSNGVCITTTGAPVILTDAHTITSFARIPSSDFEEYVAAEFSDYLGFSACTVELSKANTTPAVTVKPVTSVFLPTTANSTASALRAPSAFLPATANSTASLLPAPSASLPATAVSITSPAPYSSNATNPIVTPPLNKPIKIGISIGVVLVGILLISLVAVIWRKRRFRLAAITAKEQRSTQDKQEGKSANRGDGQPYLQQKAELDAEEQQRHELDAWQSIYELDGETEVREFPGGIYERQLAVTRTRQEVRDGEHGQELDS